MKKIILFLFTIIIAIPVFISAGKANNYNYFYKIDEEERIISDAEFKIRDINKTVIYNVNYDSDKQVYYYESEINDDYNKLVSILPSSVKDIVSGFENANNIIPLINVAYGKSTIKNFDSMVVECGNYGLEDRQSKLQNYELKKLSVDIAIEWCYVVVPTVMVIEETKTPEGFEKETMVTPATIILNYDVDNETYNFTNKKAQIKFYKRSNIDDDYDVLKSYLIEDNSIIDFNQFYKYDSNLNYDNIEDVYNTFINYEENMTYPITNCENQESLICTGCPLFPNSILENSPSELMSCSPIVVDKKGHSDISINSYVNSEEEVNLTESGNVQIKVFLKNQGSAPSYDNVVVSEVPEGVEYVEGSANANGVYNPEDRTVTWNLEYLDAHDGYIFAYDVAVTTGQTSNIYVTTSSVTSNENTTPVESNEARVTTPGMGSEDIPDNPKTGDERMFVIILGLLIGFTIMFYVHSKRIVKL